MSLDPVLFSEMVRGIRTIENSIGCGIKKIASFEKEIMLSSMRDIYASRDIKKGEKISQKDILLLRPGNGISLKEYNSILGKISARDIKKYEKI